MKHSRPISIVGAAAFAAIALMLLLGDNVPDAPANERTAQGANERNEVAYPPPNPSYPEVAAAPAPAPGKGEFDLCGYGPVDPEQLPPAFEAEADSVILRVTGELARSGDDRARALGLSAQAWVAALAADRAVTAEDPKTCRETALCNDRAAAAYTNAAQPAVEALVRLATTTRDPFAYVTALRLCRTLVPDAPPAACGALSVEQWAQVDPDNAFPWLLAARNARQGKDAAAFEDALLRASRAKVFDRRATQHGRILFEVDTRQEPVRTLIVQRLATVEAREDPADYFSNFTMFAHYCARRDEPGRREMCSDLAWVLAERSPDRLGFEVGAAIAERTGLIPDNAAIMARRTGALEYEEGVRRLGAARRDQAALNNTARIIGLTAENLTCKAAGQTEEWLRGVAVLGEREYLRQRTQADRLRASAAAGVSAAGAPVRRSNQPGSR